MAEELENRDDVNRAFRVTRNVLHTVRDVLTPEESLHLIAQLPMIIKGIYVDGWSVGKVDRIRYMEEFLDDLRSKSDRPEVDFGNDDKAVHVVQCVLDVLQRHITVGEAQDVMGQFPDKLRTLWRSHAAK